MFYKEGRGENNNDERNYSRLIMGLGSKVMVPEHKVTTGSGRAETGNV